jgi:alpha/beta superfamily hydrolase
MQHTHTHAHTRTHTHTQFTALTTLREYAAKYHESLPTPGPLDLYVIDGADHFFEGHWQVCEWRVCARVSTCLYVRGE